MEKVIKFSEQEMWLKNPMGSLFNHFKVSPQILLEMKIQDPDQVDISRDYTFIIFLAFLNTSSDWWA